MQWLYWQTVCNFRTLVTLTFKAAEYSATFKNTIMERIELLISRLKEQFDQNADPSILLGTVQLLQFELSKLTSKTSQSLGTTKVAVMLPATTGVSAESFGEYNKYAPKPVIDKEVEVVTEEDSAPPLVQKNGQLDMAFDPMMEIPTLSHQPKEQEWNDTSANTESLNDRLKEVKTELMEKLKDSPVKDLRKAVGINDRFVFINDLFRGDESMYERSIKTINSFSIYAEAEYWITRELKVKLGWDKNSPVVQHFDQLVKRRFS